MHPAALRSPHSVARRLLALAAVSGVASGLDREEILFWLKHEFLWPAVLPTEERFLTSLSPSPKDSIAFSWRMEAVYVLGWALRLRDDLEPPTAEASIGSVLEQMPGPGDAVAGFVESCALRPAGEIQAAVEAYFDAHASCCACKSRGQPERHGYDIEVVQERHRALNWLVQYEHAEWDHVATDT